MTSIPDLHPLLNFETMRCDLQRCCRETESEIKDQRQALLESVTGPEQQLVDEDIRELLVAARWLRRRVYTFQTTSVTTHVVSVTARDEWNQFSEQAIAELTKLHTQWQKLQTDSQQSQPASTDDCGSEDSCRSESASPSEVEAGCEAGSGAADEVAAGCDHELCCC